jgi:plasmid maintenance system antidote protein VapI
MNTTEFKALLESAGIAQRELARRLHLNERTIRRYCDGRSTLRIPTAVEFAVKFMASRKVQTWDEVPDLGYGK